MNKPLDIGETLSASWETFTKNAAALIVGFLLMAIVGGISMGICLGPLLVGYCRMCLRANRGEKVEIGDVFKGFDTFGPAFVLMLLVGLCVMIGMMLLFIPGLIAGYLLFWSFWFMADGETSATECMKKSSELARADVGAGIVFVLVNGIVNAVGNAIPFGSLITGPIAMAMAGSGFDRAVNGGAQSHEVDSYQQPMQPGA